MTAEIRSDQDLARHVRHLREMSEIICEGLIPDPTALGELVPVTEHDALVVYLKGVGGRINHNLADLESRHRLLSLETGALSQVVNIVTGLAINPNAPVDDSKLPADAEIDRLIHRALCARGWVRMEEAETPTDQAKAGVPKDIVHARYTLRLFVDILYDGLIPSPSELRYLAFLKRERLLKYVLDVVLARVCELARGIKGRDGVLNPAVQSLVRLLYCLYSLLSVPYEERFQTGIERYFPNTADCDLSVKATFELRGWTVAIVDNSCPDAEGRDFYFTDGPRR